MRLPALLAGLALIPATYQMVRRLADPRAAVLAAALVAASEPLVSFSVNGRGYSLLCLVTVLLVTTAGRIRDGGNPADWVAFAVLPAFGYFTIPVMLYPHCGVTLWLLIGRATGRTRGPRFDRLVIAVLSSFVLTAILYVPTLVQGGSRIRGDEPVCETASPRRGGARTASFARRSVEAMEPGHPPALAVASVAAWAVALVVTTRERGGVRRLSGLMLTVFVSSIGVVLYQSVVPFHRVWIFLLPLYLGVIASGLGAIVSLGLKGRSARAQGIAATLPVLLVLGLAALVIRSGSIPKEAQQQTLNHGDSIAKRLKPVLGPDDAVIAELPCEAPLKYYFSTNGMPVEPLYDYRIARARRLFIVVNRPNGQTPRSVLAYNKVVVPADDSPRLTEDYGLSALYELVRH